VGYPQFSRRREDGSYRMTAAHRLAFAFANGREAKAFILHSCDNKWCVNPRHLHEGTQTTNMREASQRDRIRKGVEHEWSKYTPGQISTVEALFAKGFSQTEIAEKVGVNRKSVWWILRRRSPR
jgi:DNA-directed RNA polymerase specialized sigma24 family protein